VYNRASFSKFHHIKNLNGTPTSVPLHVKSARKTTRSSPEDWIIAQIEHPAVIGNALWDRAHARLKDRRKLHARAGNAEYIFSGLIDCTACDHHYQGHTAKKGQRRIDGSVVTTREYLCGGYDSKGRAICPVRWTVGEVQLFDAAIAMIERRYQWLLEEPGIEDAIQRRAMEIATRPTVAVQAKDEIKRRLGEISERISILLASVSKENLQMLDDHLTKLRLEQERLAAELSRADAQPTQITIDESAIRRAAKAIRNDLKVIATASVDLKRRFLLS